MAVFSCNDGEVIENKQDNSSVPKQELVQKTDQIIIHKITDSSLSSEIKTIFKQNQELAIKMAGAQDFELNMGLFDFDNIYKSELTGVKGEAFTINLKDPSQTDLSFVIFKDENNVFVNPMIIKSVKEKE